MTSPCTDEWAARPLSELVESGLLWLINRTVFYPRGLAVALYLDDDDTVTGWSLHRDPEGGPWSFSPATDADRFQRAERTIADALRGARLLECGLCYEEDGEEIHPHPECTIVADRRARILDLIRGEMERGPFDLIARIADRVLEAVPPAPAGAAPREAPAAAGPSPECACCGKPRVDYENFQGDQLCARCADCDCGDVCIRTDLFRPQSWACTGTCREPFHGLDRCERHHRPHPVDGRLGLWHEGTTQDGSTLYWQDGDPGATPHVPPGTCTATWKHPPSGLITCAENTGHCAGPDCWHWGVSMVTGVRMQWKEGIPGSTPPTLREDTARTAEDTTRTPRPRVEVTVSTDTDTPASTSGDTPRTRRPILSMDIVGKPRTARQDTAEDTREDTARTPVDTDTDTVSDDDLTLGPDGLTDVERTRQTVRDTLRAELSCDDDNAIWGLTLAITRALHAMPRHAPQLCTVDVDELRKTIRDSLGTLRPTDDDDGAQARGAAYYASVTGLSEVRGICPACRRTSLFLGSGGYLTCAHLECTAPDSATTVMENPPWAADECGRPDCTEALRKAIFLHHEVNTAYETLRFNVNSAAMWLIDYKHQSAFARARQSRRFLHGLGYMLRDRGPIKPLDRQGTST